MSRTPWWLHGKRDSSHGEITEADQGMHSCRLYSIEAPRIRGGRPARQEEAGQEMQGVKDRSPCLRSTKAVSAVATPRERSDRRVYTVQAF